jgi:transcriptional regulator with XRE-family HTH domain
MAPGTKGFDVIADQILAALEASGWTITDLANASGVPRVGLSNWLNGNRPLRADYLARLLAPLGLAILRPAAARASR